MIKQGITIAGLNSVLRLAAREGDFELLKLALENGAEIDDVDKLKRTALNLTCQYSTPGGLDCFKFLYGKGAKVDIVQSDGKSALLYAAERREARLVELLLERGADPNRKTCLDQTALHLAISAHLLGVGTLLTNFELRTMQIIIRGLCDHGAEVVWRDWCGRTPLELAETMKSHFVLGWRLPQGEKNLVRRKLTLVTYEWILSFLREQEAKLSRRGDASLTRKRGEDK